MQAYRIYAKIGINTVDKIRRENIRYVYWPSQEFGLNTIHILNNNTDDTIILLQMYKTLTLLRKAPGKSTN